MGRNRAAEGNRKSFHDMGSSAAYEQALRFLEKKPRSSSEIYLRLISRGFKDEEIQETLERLAKAGIVDDRNFALRYAEEILSKGYGSLKIKRKLTEKGIDRELVEETIERFSDKEKRRAKEVLKIAIQKLGFGSDEESRNKMILFLAKRGFSEESSIEAVDSLNIELFSRS